MEFEVAMTTGEIINARYDKWEKIMEICAIYIYDLFMRLVLSLEAFSNTFSDQPQMFDQDFYGKLVMCVETSQ